MKRKPAVPSKAKKKTSPRPKSPQLAPPNAAALEEADGNLLSQAVNLFRPQSAPTSDASLPTPSGESFGRPPLSAEAQRLLDGVPDVIGAEASQAASSETAGQDLSAAVMVQRIIKPEELRWFIEGAFDLLAVWFQSEHWKLTEGEAMRLAEPGAEVLTNSLLNSKLWFFQKLMEWAAANPGALSLCFAAATIVGPRAKVQWATYLEKKSIPRAAKSANVERPPARPAATGFAPAFDPIASQPMEGSDGRA